jgi:AraC family transcriptional regulator, ethanolamine operon transcriptional activator
LSSLRAFVDGRTPVLPPARRVDVVVGTAEEMQAAAGGGVRFAQLEPGRLRGRYVGVQAQGLRIGVEEWSLGILRIGHAPPGSVTFLVPAGHGGSPRIQRRPVAAGDVVVRFGGEEIDYRSAGPARLVTVSVDRTALDAHVRVALGRRLGELRLQGRLNGLRADDGALLRLCRAAASRHALGDPFARTLEKRILGILLAGFEAACPPCAPRRGRALARKAEACLRQSLAEPPSIADLCGALHVSPRTLHEAFREHLGTTPKAYLKVLRLNAARHDLLDGGAAKRVTDAALDWGFLHFGWFARDYRRLFGETPSQTLQRGRVEAGRRPFGRPRTWNRPGEPALAAWAM